MIVATQLLASMMNNPEPTRAEVNDIAGAVLAGVDCLMLSDETTLGKYPVEAVEFLEKAATVAEKIYTGNGPGEPVYKIDAVNMGLAFAAAELAERHKTECIFVPTKTGKTAKLASAMRPATGIIALCQTDKVARSLSLYYGVRTIMMTNYRTIDQMLEKINRVAISMDIKKYIILAGRPNRSGSTSALSYVERS